MATVKTSRRRVPRFSRSWRRARRRSPVLCPLSAEEIERNRQRLIVAAHYRDPNWSGWTFEPRIHVNEDVDILSLLGRDDDGADFISTLTEPDD